MSKISLLAICTFGLETIVKRELEALGYVDLKTSNGKVEFEAEIDAIAKLNIWLRSADRVLIKMGEFKASTFEELFENTQALPWEDWIEKDGNFKVEGVSVKSVLGSVRACQSIVEKAVVERLKHHYKTDWFSKSGPNFNIKVSLRNDIATLTLDTSGSGLNRRGYRQFSSQASLKETMAAALVQLSFWDEERILLDPMCGAGTLLIEAAMMARNIAPGLQREFVSETWARMDKSMWLDVRDEAQAAIKNKVNLKIYGSDNDPEMIKASERNARNAGVFENIHFEIKDVKDVWIDQEFGVMISNPPYGIKLGAFQDINQIYISLHKTFKKKMGWSVYVLTADKKFPDYFKRSTPDKVRKLYNGNIEVNFYQYFGKKPS